MADNSNRTALLVIDMQVLSLSLSLSLSPNSLIFFIFLFVERFYTRGRSVASERGQSCSPQCNQSRSSR
jgi:hypothetical protein